MCGERRLLDVGHCHGNDTTLPLHDAENRSLVGVSARTPTLPTSPPADVCFVGFHSARQRVAVLFHKLASNQVRHAPGRLVRDAKLALQLLCGDAASSAGHEVHRIEPQMQRGRRLVEDRPRCWVEVVPATRTRPRLALLRHAVALEDALRFALRAVRVFAIRRVALAPKDFETRRIVGVLLHELHEGVAGLRRLGSDWLVAVHRWHRSVPPPPLSQIHLRQSRDSCQTNSIGWSGWLQEFGAARWATNVVCVNLCESVVNPFAGATGRRRGPERRRRRPRRSGGWPAP